MIDCVIPARGGSKGIPKKKYSFNKFITSNCLFNLYSYKI